jgi:hypothetical protein
MVRWAGGGIIRSSVATRYQLGLLRQAGSVIVPLRASTPHGSVGWHIGAGFGLAGDLGGCVLDAVVEWLELAAHGRRSLIANVCSVNFHA